MFNGDLVLEKLETLLTSEGDDWQEVFITATAGVPLHFSTDEKKQMFKELWDQLLDYDNACGV